MDEWFYELHGPGRNMLTVPIYGDMVFFNTSRVDYSADRIVQDKFLEDFDLVKEFKHGYHGPAVWIYKAKKLCAPDHKQPPKRAFGWFGDQLIK